MTEHFKTPWHVDPLSATVYASDVPKGPARVADMRGWGYLTGKGHGAMAMSEDEAIDIQRANAAFIVKAVNNHDALVAFFKWAMRDGPWEGGDLDGASVQEKAESLGLIVSVPYDPDKHGADNEYGCDAGDPWFEFAPDLRPRHPVGQAGRQGERS